MFPLEIVMLAHSRSEGRRAPHAYVAGIHVFRFYFHEDVDGRDKPGQDGEYA
jgi:hypothetical protein